jgi:phosphoribosylformylglycinamidine synthase
MAFAGGLGARVTLSGMPRDADAASDFVLLFSESPSRFLVEARPECSGELAALWNGLPFCRLGEVTGRKSEHGLASPALTVHGLLGSPVIDAEIAQLKTAWQEPLRW